MEKARRRVPSAASPRRRLAAAARHALRRISVVLGGGRASLLRALLLALALWAAALTILRAPFATGSDRLEAPLLRDSPRQQTVKLDGRALAKPLPSVYPNGETNRFACDLPALRFQCEIDGDVGCRAYPQLFPAADILRNWSPDDPDNPPAKLFSSICRFDVSDPVRRLVVVRFTAVEMELTTRDL